MAAGDETCFRHSAAHDKFRLHAVGTDGGHPQVIPLAAEGIAVAVHVERKRAAEYAVLVAAHAFQQPGKLRAVAVERDIEHVLLRHETEGVCGVRPLRGRGQRQEEHQQEGGYPSFQFFHIVIFLLLAFCRQNHEWGHVLPFRHDGTAGEMRRNGRIRPTHTEADCPERRQRGKRADTEKGGPPSEKEWPPLAYLRKNNARCAPMRLCVTRFFRIPK